MKLYITKTSPYARLARIAVIEKGLANEIERLNKIIRASITKFGPESDPVLASELLKTAISLLRRGSGATDQGQLFERVQ